jgi:hypothetical protein
VIKAKYVGVFAVLGLLFTQLPAAETTLVKDGKALGAIVVAKDQSDQKVLTAARDLADYVQRITGVRVAVTTDDNPGKGSLILIGETSLASVDPAWITDDKIAEDGFIIRTVDQGILICGRVPYGTAHGVYYLAEEYMNVHWYTVEDDEPTCPQNDTITFPRLNLTVKPAFRWRGLYYSFQQADKGHAAEKGPLPEKFLENRDHWWEFNRLWSPLSNAIDVGHCYFKFIPAELYETHPEYFPYLDYTFKKDSRTEVIKANADGKLPNWPYKTGRHVGNPESTQRCLSNPEVFQKAVAFLENLFENDDDLAIGPMSANDGPWWCVCEPCKAMGKTIAHRNLLFTNAVAKAIEPKFPDARVIALAYWDTIDPPLDMKVRRNVLPFVAALWKCRLHSIYSDCPESVIRRHHLEGWRKMSNIIAFYPYMNDGPFATPTITTIAEDYRFVRDLGCIGGFREHQHAPRVGWAMINWIETKLLWDPDQDVKKLVRQFMEGYYGRSAATHMNSIFTKLEEHIRSSDTQYPSTHNHRLEDPEFLKKLIDRCYHDIVVALTVAKSAPKVYRQRVERDLKTLLGEIPWKQYGIVEYRVNDD